MTEKSIPFVLCLAFVAYNAYFADGNDFSKHEYLVKIIFNAFSR